MPAYSAGWTPNLLFSALGIYLLVKTASESPFKPNRLADRSARFYPAEVEEAFEDV